MENILLQEIVELRSGRDLPPEERERLSNISQLSPRVDPEVAQKLLREFNETLGKLISCDFSTEEEKLVSRAGERLVSFFKKNAL